MCKPCRLTAPRPQYPLPVALSGACSARPSITVNRKTATRWRALLRHSGGQRGGIGLLRLKGRDQERDRRVIDRSAAQHAGLERPTPETGLVRHGEGGDQKRQSRRNDRRYHRRTAVARPGHRRSRPFRYSIRRKKCRRGVAVRRGERNVAVAGRDAAPAFRSSIKATVAAPARRRALLEDRQSLALAGAPCRGRDDAP